MIDERTQRLVIAARRVVFGGELDRATVADPEALAALSELDAASEAFAADVAWTDEPR